MSSPSSRRTFLQATAGSALLGLADLSPLAGLSPLRAEDARLEPDRVRFSDDIEPLVRLIEDTPRDKCPAMLIEQLRGGLPFRQALAALFLAGIRNVNPQPPGFKFHCVFVIHACHQMSLDSAPGERLLPLFYALDMFKNSQAQDVKQGDFVLRPVTGTLPSTERAWEEFRAAMDDWDEPRADRAITALVRSRGAHEVIEGLWTYGARDYRNIGHKAIFVAHAWRTLQTIGWQHAEPTLRSLVLGLLDFGKAERVNGYALDDQTYPANVERARQALTSLPTDWTGPAGEDEATVRALLEPLREGKYDDATQLAVQLLSTGKARSGAVWDAAHLAAGEWMMRQPGIFGIHTITSLNALHYAFRMTAEPQTRLLLTLQGLGWMGQFQQLMSSPEGSGRSGKWNDVLRITELEPAEIPASPGEAAEDIFATISTNKPIAARKTFRLAQIDPEATALLQTARRLVCLKGREEHEYKYPAAIFEDFALVSPRWRPHLLAASVYYLPGSAAANNPVVDQALDAARALS